MNRHNWQVEAAREEIQNPRVLRFGRIGDHDFHTLRPSLFGQPESIFQAVRKERTRADADGVHG